MSKKLIFLIILIVIVTIINIFYYHNYSFRVTEKIIIIKRNESFIVKECELKRHLLGDEMMLKFEISNEFRSLVFDNQIKRYEKKLNLSFLKNLKHGGSYEPNVFAKTSQDCKIKSIAFVIPYKNRLNNLYVFLYNMHPFLQRQQLKYTIFLVEQLNDSLFNKGILNNAAFNEIILNKNPFFINDNDYFDDYDCVMYHDVDLLPTDDLNLYSCPTDKPTHFSMLVDDKDYFIEYPILVGGVLIFSKEHFIKVNGYSNRYWGWGGEDDDMYFRLQDTNISVNRPLKSTVYTMLNHVPQKKNDKRYEILNGVFQFYKHDGLNSLSYKLNGIVKYPLFTHLLIDVQDQ